MPKALMAIERVKRRCPIREIRIGGDQEIRHFGPRRREIFWRNCNDPGNFQKLPKVKGPMGPQQLKGWRHRK